MRRNQWTKSTHSGSNGQCVEVRHRGVVVDVRDSADQSGPFLIFMAAEWAAFLAGVKTCEFDLDPDGGS